MQIDNLEKDLVYDVTIFGETYGVSGDTRSRAVTTALERYMGDHPNTEWTLSILRSRCKTRVVDSESELLDDRMKSING